MSYNMKSQISLSHIVSADMKYDPIFATWQIVQELYEVLKGAQFTRVFVYGRLDPYYRSRYVYTA